MKKIPNLNKRITINRAISTSDGAGGYTSTTTTESVWAAISSLSGNEIYRYSASESKIDTKFIIRYRPESVIQARDSVTYNGQTWRIEFVDPFDYRKDYIALICVQDNNTGAG